MTRCPRCGGQDGAHYAACVFTNMVQRWLGADYPLFGPQEQPPTPTDIAGLALEVVAPLRDELAAMRRDLDAALEAITRPPAPPAESVTGPTDPAEFTTHLDELDREAAAEASARETTTAPVSGEWTAERVKQLRASRGWTQVEMCKQVGCARTLVGQWENGITNVGKKYRARLDELEAATPAAKKALPAELRARNEQDRAAASAIMAKVIAAHTEADPESWLPAPALLELAQAITPEFTKFQVGWGMGYLGYQKRQFRIPGQNGYAPVHYKGLKLKNTPSEPTLDEQMAQRREAEAAARAEMPAPPPQKERYRYDGPRPGGEVPAEFRTMLEPLWSTPGWSYAPHNANGGGKPRVTNPQGTSFVVPNTPSDVRSVKNVRAALRRLGAPL